MVELFWGTESIKKFLQNTTDQKQPISGFNMPPEGPDERMIPHRPEAVASQRWLLRRWTERTTSSADLKSRVWAMSIKELLSLATAHLTPPPFAPAQLLLQSVGMAADYIDRDRVV